MSGVRNLRAMFEQKGESQPDRGRSPGPGGFATPSPSASPRPLSKVRTSFVAIEKDGRIGLRREPSRDSETVSSRRFSNDTDTSTPQPISEKSDVFSDNMASTVASFRTNLSHEAIPESPRQDTPVKPSPKKEGKSPALRPNANPDKVTDEEEPHTKMLSGSSTDSSAIRLGGTVLNGGIGDTLSNAPSTATKAKAPGASKTAPRPAAPVSTAKTTTRAPKSPLTAKASSAKETAKAPSGKEPAKEPAKAAVAANPKKATATKTATAKPAAIDLPPSGTGFVKPKPKSPTRPVKLPSSLTTHTASSAQKYGSGNAAPAPRRSLSRTSGNAQHLSVNPTTQRSPSRNSVSTTGTATTKTLKHKPSNANVSRSRPSLGPPPKPAGKEQPVPKKDAPVDEGFLARMMRPTASSAKKTSDKAPLTPPRKQTAPIKKPDTIDAEKPAKRVAAKMQASPTQASSIPSRITKNTVKPVAVKESLTAKEIAPVVAQTETAESAIAKAKLSADTSEAPANEKKEAVNAKPETESAVKDDHAIIVQEETKDNVEVSKASADIAAATENPHDEAPALPEVQPIPESVTTAEVDEAEVVASVPVISEDPLKVEDIEDVVQDAEEPGYPFESTDSAELPQEEDIIEAKEPSSAPAEEQIIEVEEIAEEPSEAKESIPAPIEEQAVEVHETTEEPLETKESVPIPTEEQIVEVKETTGEPFEAKESIPNPTEEQVVEVKETAEEPLEAKGTTPDIKETANEETAKEETKKDGLATADTPQDASTEDHVDEAVVKEATAAAL